MFWLGVGDDAHTLHDSRLSPDEAAIETGVKAIIKYLSWRMSE